MRLALALLATAGCALEMPPDPSDPPSRMQDPSGGAALGGRAIGGAPRALVVVTPLVGACRALAIGVDDNGDRRLAPGEARARLEVCDAPVAVETEPPGSTCRYGGQVLASGNTVVVLCAASLHPLLVRVDACAISAGFDVDGDGALEDAEIESAADACAQ